MQETGRHNLLIETIKMRFTGPARRPFRDHDDSHDVKSLRLVRRAIRGLVRNMRHVAVTPRLPVCPTDVVPIVSAGVEGETPYSNFQERTSRHLDRRT